MFGRAMIAGLVFALVGWANLAAQDAGNKAPDAAKDAKAPAAAPKPADLPAKAPAAAPKPPDLPAMAPAPAPAPADAFQVKVVSVTGVAHRRLAADPKAKWEPVKVGDLLGEQTLLRTGLGTTVVLELSDRGRVTVASGTKMGIGEFRKQGSLVQARLGLKYGSMRANVEAARGANDMRISTPVATLSVRGSGLNMWFCEYGLNFCATEHQWEAALPNHRRMDVREGECSNGDLTDWARLAREKRYVAITDPLGQTEQEKTGFEDNGDGRAIFNFAPTGNPFHFTGLLPCSRCDDDDYYPGDDYYPVGKGSYPYRPAGKR